MTYTKPIPLTSEEIKLKKENLKNMDDHDIDIFLKSESKNTLESYIYETRSKLKQEIYKQVSEETVRTNYLQKLEEYEDWLYTEQDEPLESVHNKIKELKDVFDPIKERALELELRDEVIEKTNKLIKDMNEKLINIADKKPWTVETMKIVKTSLDKEITWWKQVQEEQKKLDNLSEPAFKAKQVEYKFKAIDSMIDSLDKMKKPVEKKTTKKEGKKEQQSSKTKEKTDEQSEQTEEQKKKQSEQTEEQKEKQSEQTEEEKEKQAEQAEEQKDQQTEQTEDQSEQKGEDGKQKEEQKEIEKEEPITVKNDEENKNKEDSSDKEKKEQNETSSDEL